MYPQRELTRLAAYKTALQWDIALRRTQCAEAAARVAQPLAWLDRMLALWRRLSPFVQFLPVLLGGFFATRTVLPRLRFLGRLAYWSLAVFGTVRGVCSAIKIRGGSVQTANDRS